MIFKRLAGIPNVALLVRPIVPTPLRAPITTWEPTQTFFNKTFDLHQFFHNVKEFDLFKSMLMKS